MTAIAVQLPRVDGHPNRIPFDGVLTLLDVASDKAPSGARGHKVVMTKRAAVDALPGLLGMAVDFKPGWDGHDVKQKCGIITAARIQGQRVCVSGYLYGRHYAEMLAELLQHPVDALGMSYELADVHIADMTARVWTVEACRFMGAAILLRSKAAYRQTSFALRPPTMLKGITGVEIAAVAE